MKKNKILLCIIMIIQLLGCENLKKGLGIEKNAPNEFLVEKKQSILLPPDYNLIPPDLKQNNNENSNQTKKEESVESLLKTKVEGKSAANIENKTNRIDSKNNSIENQILNKIN